MFAIYVVASVEGFISTYPTAASRAGLAQSLGSNAGLQALFGIPHGIDTVAGFTAWRTLGVLVIVGAIWGILTSTRLLRGEEEAGRWELMLAGPTTRGRATAYALAGMSAGVGSLWVLTAATTLAVGRAHDAHFSFTASLFFATALVASAAMFMAVGGLCSQLAATRRQAAGLAATVLGISFVLRMVADSGSTLRWVRWTTPLGWIEALQPLVHSHALPLVPVIATTLAAAWVAIALAAGRDIGASVLPDHDSGPARTRLLGGPLGLATRLVRGSTLAWVIGVGAGGFFIGLVSRAAGDAIAKSNTFAKLQASLGGHAAGAAAYLGIAFVIVSALIGMQAAAQSAATRATKRRRATSTTSSSGTSSRARWLGSRLTDRGGRALCRRDRERAHRVDRRREPACGRAVHESLRCRAERRTGRHPRPRSRHTGPGHRATHDLDRRVLGSRMVVPRRDRRRRRTANHWLLDLSLFHHIAPAPAADPRWVANGLFALLGVTLAMVGTALFVRRDIASA